MTLVDVAEVVFEYYLLGGGFSEAVFRVGDTRLDLRLGDSPDPLKELMAAALAIAGGDIPPEVLWDPEDGGEYRWQFKRNRRTSDRVRVRVAYVASYAGARGARRTAPGTVLAADCLAREFCSAVAEGAAQALERYGPDQYVDLWLSPFPFDLLDALQAAVGQLPS